MRVGVLGAGTVGSALIDLLARHGPTLTDRLGEPLEVAAVVVRDAAKPRRLSLGDGSPVTTDAARVVDDPGVPIVVELMGGTSPARDYALRALRRGASLVTANKALVAAHGPELFDAAAAGGGDVLFEAAVGAAVPVVSALERALSAARVRAVAGVLNGSTNYLLAQMADGMSLAEAVGLARSLGYLEADAADDLEGRDPARKIAILASLAAGAHHHAPEGAQRRGLDGVGPADLALAADLGMAVKLLAVAERSDEDETFALWVAPALVGADHPLAAVHGAANAVAIAAAPGGETLLAGQGAGGPPTAQAVAGDVLSAARRRRRGQRGPLWRWRAAVAAPAPMPDYPYVVRLACAPGDRARLEAAALHLPGAERVVPGGGAALGVATAPLSPAAAATLAERLASLTGVLEVGAPLVLWPGLERAEAERRWWRAPALAPAAAARGRSS
jgi:homoserine dehydrogenase